MRFRLTLFRKQCFEYRAFFVLHFLYLHKPVNDLVHCIGLGEFAQDIFKYKVFQKLFA